MITVAMPLADTHEIAEQVFRGLVAQTVPWTLQVVTRPAAIDSRESEGLSRRLCLQSVIACNDLTRLAAVVMMDRDVVLANSRAFEDAIKRLTEGVSFVHVRAKSRYSPPDHMDIGCVVVEAIRETLQDLRDVFEAVSCPAGCWCSEVNKMCRARGYVQEWLSDEQDAATIGYTK